MKKKIIISIMVCLIIIIGIVGYIMWTNRTVSTIMLDINPSIKINLTRDEKVKNVVALNEDAKNVISNNINGKSLEEAFETLITNLLEKEYAHEESDLDVILHAEGKITNEDVAKQIEFEFGKKNVHSEIIIIDNITKEDEELAKKYNISPAKVVYINSIVRGNKNINIDSLADKPVSELNETKITGKYCDSGYILEGDWCLKEIERVPALSGEVCPIGYFEYNNECYEEVDSIESNNYTCRDDYKLVADKCVRQSSHDALGKCDTGDYDNGYCIVKEYIGDATEYCRLTPATDILIDHKCYGPKPTINGGCLNDDIIINGSCVDMNSYYKSDWICPDGTFITNPDGSLMNEDKKCYKETKTTPISYYCDGPGEVNGAKCEIKEVEDAIKERVCPSGYTLVNNDRCINYNKVVNKTNGYYCEMDNAKLNEKTCIIYEMIEAQFN